MGQKIIGYIRISTDKQDLDKQRHLLLEYARKERLIVDEFIEAEVLSRQDVGERRIDELQSKLQKAAAIRHEFLIPIAMRY
jgi:DNA invertase Pin-like site-specific DNA recombinase